MIGDGVIVAAAGQLLAYDVTTGDLRWSGPEGDGYSSPHVATIDGVAQVLLVSSARTISVAPADGTVLWQHSWGGTPIVQPAVTAEGDILVAPGAASGTRRLRVTRAPGSETAWRVEERWTSNGLKPYFNDFVVHEGHAFGFDGRILASHRPRERRAQVEGRALRQRPDDPAAGSESAAGPVRERRVVLVGRRRTISPRSRDSRPSTARRGTIRYSWATSCSCATLKRWPPSG